MIPVTKSYLPDKEKFFRYIDQIYHSNQLTNNGPLLRELENRLAKYLGVKNLILVANGTLALQVAYKAMNLQGSAITTPFSFPATASSLVWESIKPIFADIDAKSWNIDPKQIEMLIQPHTSAIIPVHVFGNPCEVEAIQEIARRHSLKIIYDGAHAFGVKYKDESILNWGDITTLSFHATKLFHTIEGGAIVTNNDALAEKIKLMINFGIENPEVISELGINAKLNEFQAVMGLCILDEMEYITKERKMIWHQYYEQLQKFIIFQTKDKASSHNYSYCPILFEKESLMKKVQKKLNEKAIFPRRYFYPSLDSLPYINNQKNMIVTKDISSRILCLPIYPGLSRESVNKICRIIKNEYLI